MRFAPLAATVVSITALTACATKPTPVSAPPTTPTAPQASAPSNESTVRKGSREDFRVSAPERVFFAVDDHALTADARAALQSQAAWLAAYPSVRVLIAGNCDERGTREYNLALGARRAAAVKDYLTSLGVAASRIDTISYGKDRPLDPRSSESGWSLNRNAHTTLLNEAVS